MSARILFPEPSEVDESPPAWDETPIEWFRRSTTPRARAVREFLNVSLGYFPRRHAESLARRLNNDFQSFFFEMIVGRYLQVLGATVEPEPIGSNGTRVDYRATFPDGVVISIECVSKRFNLKAHETVARNGKMATMLEEVGPTNWAMDFHSLPDANSAKEFQPYVLAARGWYTTLPLPVEGGAHLTFEFEGDPGRMNIEAIPFPTGTMPNHIGPAVAWRDDAIERLRLALIDRHKHRQAAGAIPPVLLAVDSPFMGPDAPEFDQALFGQTVDHRAFDPRETVGLSFNPNGILVTNRDIPFAGVLAFLGMSMNGARDPVLYINPYQRWRLPLAIASHEQRVWSSQIEATPAAREPTINEIGFVKYDDAQTQ